MQLLAEGGPVRCGARTNAAIVRRIRITWVTARAKLPPPIRKDRSFQISLLSVKSHVPFLQIQPQSPGRPARICAKAAEEKVPCRRVSEFPIRPHIGIKARLQFLLLPPSNCLFLLVVPPCDLPFLPPLAPAPGPADAVG